MRANSNHKERLHASIKTAITLSEIHDPAHLRCAMRRVVRNDGAPGIDRETTKELKRAWASRAPVIESQLRERKYLPSPLRAVPIPKPNGGFRRLDIPTVQDRVVQESIAMKLTKVLELGFHVRSFGYRPNRSTLQTVQAGREDVLRGNELLVPLDVKDCFGGLDHDLILRLVSPFVADDVAELIQKFLRAGNQLGFESKGPNLRGAPQGGPISPILANLVLNELDWHLDALRIPFVRYADDICLFLKTKTDAVDAYEEVVSFMSANLDLQIKNVPHATNIVDFNEVDLLGFAYGDDPDVSLRVPERRVKQLQERLWERAHDLRSTRLTHFRESFSPAIRGWCEYYRNCEISESTLQKLDEVLLEILRKNCPRTIRKILGSPTNTSFLPAQVEKCLKCLDIRGFTRTRSLMAQNTSPLGGLRGLWATNCRTPPRHRK